MEQTGVATQRVLDIYPIGGMVTSVPGKLLPLHQSPDMLNMSEVMGRLRKRMGYAQFHAGNAALDGGQVLGLASVQDEDDGTHLFAMTEDNLSKHNAGASNWATMTGPALTGPLTALFTHDVSQNSLVFCQGVDQVMRMPFTGTTYAILNANCPAAKYMTRAADRLIIASTLETAVKKPFRVRRSVAGDHTNWTGVGSGFTDLAEFPYHVKNIRKIGARLAVYVEKAIWLGTRTGSAAAPFAFDPVITDTGLFAPHTLIGRKGIHAFLGNDSMYEFNGSQIEDIGRDVRGEIFETLNAFALEHMFAVALNDTQEELFFLCTGSSVVPDKIWVYQWHRRTWYPWAVNGPRCACLHRLDTSTSWDSMPGTWDVQSVVWDSFALQQAHPSLLTGHADGKVYIWSPLQYSDNGVGITCYWSSKDLCSEDVDPSFGNRWITLRDITFWFKDPGVNFNFEMYYSIDAGNTWAGPFAHVVTSQGHATVPYRVNHQVTGPTIRFKIQQNRVDQTLWISSIHPNVEVRDKPI